MIEREHSFSEEDLHNYVTHRAGPEMVARIDDARRNDNSLHAELTLMEALKPALAGAEAPNPPGDLEWRRLQAQIRQEQASATNAYVMPGPGRQIRTWQAAAVFLGCLALGQAAYLVIENNQSQTGYTTASQTVEKYVLAVRFVPTATEAEMSTLIRQLAARIVDGPGASGLYRLAFASASERDTALPQLQGVALVEFVAEE